jgi:hypothetical protein
VSGMENQLRDLLEAAAGEPPRRVTVAAVRRRVIRRRVLEAAGVGAVAVVVAGIDVAAASRGAGANAPSGPVSHAGAPPYYVQQSFPGTAGRPQPVVIRATATGAVTATVRCPWPNSQIAPRGITAAGNRTFFMICQKAARDGKFFAVTGARIYRFRLAGSGRISGYSPLPGGALGRHQPEGITATLDGSEVAVTIGPAAGGVTSSAPAQILVFNTRTGARAVWHGSAKLFGAGVASFIHQGRELVFIGVTRCTPAKHSATCRALRTLSTAAPGGTLDDSSLLLPLSALLRSPGGYINDVVISPDGSTLSAAVVRSPARGPDQVLAVRFSAAGRQLRVLYRMSTGNGFFYRFFESDPSGRHLLLNAGPTSGTVNGWIDHGRLIPLRPANGSNIVYETW